MCLIINERDSFESCQTKQKYKINHHLNCNRKLLIHVLSSKVCEMHYVDSNTDKFCFHWNNYKESDRKTFRGGGTYVENLRIIIISWMTVVVHWLIKQIVQTPQKEKKGFKNWRNVTKTLASSILQIHRYSCMLLYVFPRQESSLRKIYTFTIAMIIIVIIIMIIVSVIFLLPLLLLALSSTPLFWVILLE